MKLSKEILRLNNPERTCRKIEIFIKGKMKELKRDGVVLGLSGGLDSAVVAYLCMRSVGPEKVLALFMPDKDSERKSWEDAKLIADKLGIRFETIDITPVLEKIGIYELIPTEILRSKKISGWVFRRYREAMKKIGRDPYEDTLLGGGNQFIRKGNAYSRTKHRLRSVILYYRAELENFLVVGAANKTEALTGFFAKFGCDRVADIMPLGNLYKTQVREIARYLGIPPEILKKAPTPDLIPGFKDEDILGSYLEVDLILYGLELGLTPEEIASQLRIKLKEIQRIQRYVQKSVHMRESPYLIKV